MKPSNCLSVFVTGVNAETADATEQRCSSWSLSQYSLGEKQEYTLDITSPSKDTHTHTNIQHD